jgi:DHA1 family bicyclomycin/chloramphenicol resistance-like MFS transporter
MVSQRSKTLPFLLGAIIAVGPMATDMYLPAFPAIAHALHNASAPQYSLASYFVGLAIGQMTQGALSDRLGRRLPLLAGLTLYTFASLGCALAWNTDALVIFRFLMALGASAGIVIPRAMVRDLADGPAAAKMFSQLMLVMGVAPILAPMIGSLFCTWSNWRMIFVASAGFGVMDLSIAFCLLPDTLPAARRSMVGFGAVLVRYTAIARERGFISHAALSMFTSAALFAYLSASPLVFIGRYGWSPLQFSVLFGANSMAYIAYSQLNPALVNRFGVPSILSTAVCVLLVSCTGLAAVGWLGEGPAGLVVMLLACEAGFGLITPNAMVGAMTRHQAHAGSAAALLGTMQYSGGAVTGLAMGILGDGTARPMACAMLLCALAATLAAIGRPVLKFAD